MANEKLYSSNMLISALYRGELARELVKLGYGIEKIHADGRFEVAEVSRDVIEAFSTHRAEIEAAMDGRGLGTPAENQRAALMTRAANQGSTITVASIQMFSVGEPAVAHGSVGPDQSDCCIDELNAKMASRRGRACEWARRKKENA